jgi:hypothetical protein
MVLDSFMLADVDVNFMMTPYYFALTSLSIHLFPLEVTEWGLVLQLAEILNQG